MKLRSKSLDRICLESVDRISSLRGTVDGDCHFSRKLTAVVSRCVLLACHLEVVRCNSQGRYH